MHFKAYQKLWKTENKKEITMNFYKKKKITMVGKSWKKKKQK